MPQVDQTIKSYTAEYDAIKAKRTLATNQQYAYDKVMRDLLEAHDAGETLSDAEYSAISAWMF